MAAIYEWDEGKRKSNIARHGVDFTAIECFDWETALIAPDNRHTEPRFVAIGYLGERLHAAVYTKRGDNVRIISLRKANQREEKHYGQEHERR